jgi:primosomal protein N' (replication factor Y)
LSSATPRVVDIKKAKDEEMYLETISSRYFSEMPDVEIIDMKKEEKYNWIFSKKVISSIKNVVAKNKKVIVFTPTRGYANYIVCSECGYIFKCENCDVSLTFHKKERKLVCHYCGNEQPLSNFCPRCGGFKLQSRGYGTERVLTELTKLFPSEPIVRVDRTVIKSFEDLKNTFSFMKEPGRKIIVGTKMITKGLDIKDLDLVVILDSDRYTHLPDYNAKESTASLIMQVAGRSGRKEKGKVLIQTFDSDNEIYQAAINHDYTLIAEKELEQRSIYKYPPFTKLFLIMINNNKMDKVKSISQDIINELEKVIENQQVELLGPVTPIISKLRGNYRLQIILKVYQHDTSFLLPIVEKFDKDIKVYFNPPTTIL